MKKQFLLNLSCFLLCVLFSGCRVSVKVKSIEKIKVTSLPSKTDYYIGETLNTEGLCVTAYYSDNSTKDITASVSLKGFDSSKKQQQQKITVVYKDCSDFFYVNIIQKQEPKVVLTGIKIHTIPEKIEYFIGETICLDGIKVTAMYDNGTTADVTSEITYSGFDSSKKQENQKITVNYKDFTDIFYVNINSIDITDLKVVPPQKLTYYIGEKLNLEGLNVTAKYNNGTTSDVTDKVEIKGFDSSKQDSEQIVTVEFNGKTATFTVEILNIVLTKIKIISAPEKNEYSKFEKLNLDGLKVIAEYNNNTSQDITNSPDLIISDFDSTEDGQKTITLTYNEKTDSFVVTVKKASLTSITLKQPDKTNYYMDDQIDFTGMVVKANYDDGSEIDVTDMVEITGTKNSSINVDVYKPLSTDGKIKITVTYGKETANFDINVEINYVKSLTVIKSPFKDSYYPMEMVEIGDFEILAEYLNGKKETIKEKQVNLTINFENKKAIDCKKGINTIEINYKTEKTTVTFEVIDDAVNKLEIINEPKQKTFNKNQFSEYGLKLKVYYSSEKTDEVSTGWKIATDDLSTTGNKTVTVTYGEKSITYEIEVTDVYQFHDVITENDDVYYYGDFPNTRIQIKKDGKLTDDGNKIFPTDYTKGNPVKKGCYEYYLGKDNNYYFVSSSEAMYIYKVEPISWRCIKQDYNGGKLLLCENILFSCFPQKNNVISHDVNYENSDIRKCLNGYDDFTEKSFIEVAFGGKNPEELLETDILLDAGKTVKDKIFILSFEEAKNNSTYSGMSWEGITNYNYIKKTDFGDYLTGSYELKYWFLRSADGNKVYCVKNIDEIYLTELLSNPYYGICPAIVVNSPTVK